MKSAKLLVILLFTILLTGCWDKIEIEDRAFILSLGIDKAPEEDTEPNKSRYIITLVNPDTAKAEEGKVMDFITFDTKATSYTTGTLQLLQRFSKEHSYEHTKVIIFGDELLQDEILVKDILDAFFRGHQFHSSMLVYTVPGKAADVFKVKPKMKSLLAYYITGIAENENVAARIGKTSLLDFSRSITANDGDAVIPILIPAEDEVKAEGMGVIKDFKLIGKLDEDETVAYKWLNKKAKGGVIEIKKTEYSIPFTYFIFKRNISLDNIEDGKLYLTYNMETEGAVEEYTIGKKLLDDDVLQEIEKELEAIIESQSKKLVKKFQEEYKVDLIGVREYLSKYHPKLYDTVSQNFDDFFQSKVVVNVKADAKVRRIGKTQ